MAAAFGDAGDHFLRLCHGQLPGRKIVQEEQRLRTAHRNIIHAHRHEINTDRVVLVHHEGNLQFRPDSVCSGNEYGLFVFACLKAKKPAKASEVGQNFWTERRTNERLDAIDEFIARIDIHTSIAIGRHSQSQRGTLRSSLSEKTERLLLPSVWTSVSTCCRSRILSEGIGEVNA